MLFRSSPTQERFLSRTDYLRFKQDPSSWTQKVTSDLEAKSRPILPGKTRTRQPKSWGGFWGSALGVLPEEKAREMMEVEMNLSIHQLKLDEVVGNITRTNSELFKSISGIAQSVSVFTDRQTSLYGALGSLISKENQQIGMLKVLADALERGLTLALEYESLTVQCALMNEAIARMQRLISSHFTGILDVSQVPVALLQQGLLENSELSLANVRTEFRYSEIGRAHV